MNVINVNSAVLCAVASTNTELEPSGKHCSTYTIVIRCRDEL